MSLLASLLKRKAVKPAAPAGVVMYDAVDISQIPDAPAAAAGYVDGRWPTAAPLAKRFPRALILTIAVSPDHDAEALDVENGDARPQDAPGWAERQRARGVTRPCLYASAGVMQAAVIPALRAAGIPRAAVRLWSAHYTGSAHICGPGTCRELGVDADGTQWTDQAAGRSLDQSLLLPGFFATPPVPVPAPKPAAAVPADWRSFLALLPVLKAGDRDATEPWMVRRVQSLVNALGPDCAVTGSFDAPTEAAVKAFQANHGIPQSGVSDAATWSMLYFGRLL